MTVEGSEAISEHKSVAPPQSAMVIGGGVAGLQAALDLANQGYQVHLVERRTSIGGRMAAIDKTFPTLDCSACILTPRLSEVSRHPNIRIHTNAQVRKVRGRAGNFTVELLKKARYVLEDKCSGCGECVEVCPIETPNEFDENIGFRKAIYIPFPQATPHVYAIDKRDHAACRVNCPAGVNTQAFVTLLMQERFDEALKIVREAIPFPGALGRVCIGFCETQCARGNYDQSISIRNLHRFLADYERMYKKPAPVEAKIDKTDRVAVIGAGPAGIGCAYHLAKMGYPVTVFEKRERPGGLMRYAIPEYRLPREILDEEIERVRQHGVEFVFGTEVTSPKSLLEKGFKAVFIATGASKSNKLMVEGEEAGGVYHAIDFLDRVSRGEKVKIGKRVAVVGGGDAAVDSCRVAVRLGAEEVTMIYRRSQVEIPAIPGEVEDASQEGVRFMFLTAPTKVLSAKGHVTGLRLIRMKLGEEDRSGRRRPIPIHDSDFTLACDTLIIAVGQSVETTELHKDVELTEYGTIQADPISLMTSVPGVFAGGDVVLGPATVVKALGQGREAAKSIDRYLRGVDLQEGREAKQYVIAKPEINPAKFVSTPRAEMPKQKISRRKNSFIEVELGFDESQAVSEAGRCLGCTVCCECGMCVQACERKAIDHSQEDQVLSLNVGAIVMATGYELFDVSDYPRLGYGRLANVINAMEYERLINAAGPTQGNLIRLSDGRIPKNVAFVQCVGARDVSKDVPNCSRVCCMYGIKNAVMCREHNPDAKVTVYYADIRAFGKGFEEFYNMAKTRFGVEFVRGRVAEVEEDPHTGDLTVFVENTEGFEPHKRTHDLVVLSPGILPPKGSRELAEELGVMLDNDGYVEPRDEIVSPVDTHVPGVFVAGCAASPKDIPDSVTAGSAAAMRASIVLAKARNAAGTDGR
ncbi:MAG: FAD-dependent oxidoreductase [Candidatus Thorarchaeota archaeon]|nr:FAD-dependent oxidoreductase [Candidatus Thorarchaeota archaeon]